MMQNMALSKPIEMLDAKVLSILLNKSESTIRNMLRLGDIPMIQKSKGRITTHKALEYRTFINSYNPTVNAVSCTTLSIINPKSSSGKTTTAIHLASQLKRLKHRVLLIDLDMQGHASDYAGEANINEDGVYLPYEMSIHELIVAASQNRLTAELIEKTIRNVEFCDLITCDLRFSNTLRSLCNDDSFNILLFNEVIKKITKHIPYDYIIIDTPSTYSYEQESALIASDEVLIVSNPNLFSVESIRQCQANIHAAQKKRLMVKNKPVHLLGLLSTNVRVNAVNDFHYFKEIEKYCLNNDINFLSTIIKNNTIVHKAYAMNEDVYSFDPTSDVSLSYFNLTLEIDMDIKQRHLNDNSRL